MLLLGASVACGTGCSAGFDDGVDESGDAVSASQARAALELHLLDVWARPLDRPDVRLSVTRDGRAVNVDARSTTTVFLRSPGTYAIHLEAPQHQPLDVTLRNDGSDAQEGATLAETPAHATYSFGHTVRTIEGRRLPSHVLYLGLEHKWFSAEGRPARRGNVIDLLMDGEEAWASVRRQLHAARRNILVSTWWWESDFELVRSPIGTPDSERWKNTILGALEASPAEKRVLVGEFIGQDTLFHLLNTDSELRKVASTPADRFEMMTQANETRGRFRFEIPAFPFGGRVKAEQPDAPPLAFAGSVVSPVPAHDVDLTRVPFGLDLRLASYHQKFLVVDYDVAFVGGMNFRHVDWDSSQHLVYDARRMKFGAWDVTRRAVAEKSREPDSGPRKDYMLRVEGPAAADVAEVFQKRWDHLRAERARYSEHSSPFRVERDVQPIEGGVEVQVTATMPDPLSEHAIAETWFKAVRNAEQFVFIEDQYFRMPMIHDALIRRMDEVPNLKLVVVTKPVPTWSPECVQSYLAGNLFASRYPDWFLSLQLRSFDAEKREFANIDVHSKMLIVDDLFMSVGSANKNNRGMVYEAELNVAVVDPVVGGYRKRILANMLGRDARDDVEGWFEQLRVYARFNDVALEREGQGAAPRGFVYGLSFPPAAACRMQSVGPDTT